MAVNYAQLISNLRNFYDFSDKVVLCVGGGCGKLLDPAAKAKRLIVIDREAAALLEVKAGTSAKGILSPIEMICANFADVRGSGDVVYFEFCLHEMAEPEKAVAHAQTLAPEIVVFDHLPGSDWAFFAGEEDGVRRTAHAIARFGVRRCEQFQTEQRFKDYDELTSKLAIQGNVALQRAQRFATKTNIVIPMSYQILLL